MGTGAWNLLQVHEKFQGEQKWTKNSKENKNDKNDKENKSDKIMPQFYFMKMEGATAGYSSLGKVNKTSSESRV